MKRKSSVERKKEIIDAARQLIMREGVQGVTIKNISRKNRISEPAIYRHFENKRAILLGVIENFEGNLMAATEKPIERRRNPLDKLKEIMRTHLIFTEKKRGMLFAITAESIHFNDDFLRRRILQVIEKYKGRIKNILNEAKREGFLREDLNLDVAALAFFGLIQTAII